MGDMIGRPLVQEENRMPAKKNAPAAKVSGAGWVSCAQVYVEVDVADDAGLKRMMEAGWNGRKLRYDLDGGKAAHVEYERCRGEDFPRAWVPVRSTV